MKKYILILFLCSPFLLSIHSIIVAEEPNKSNVLATQKMELEIEKIKYEIQNLEQEDIRKTITLLSTIIGSVIGIIVLVWTIFQGLKTISDKTKENRQNRISYLLQALSSEQVANRLGSIRGLSQYTDYVIPELLASSSTENSVLVRTNLEDTLFLAGQSGKSEVLRANSNSILNRVQTGARIKAINIEKSIFMGLFGISPETFNFICKSYKDIYEHGLTLEHLRIGRIGKSSEEIKIEKESLEEAITYEKQLAETTRAVISRWLRDGIPLSFPFEGMDLSETNLYKVRFPRMKCQCLICQRALMRHCSIENSEVKHSVFNNANLMDANISNSDFSDSLFISAELRLVRGENVTFSKCNLKSATFSKGDLSNSNFVESICRFARFRGTVLKNCNLQHSDFIKAELQEAKLEQTKMNSADFSLAKLINANLHKVEAKETLFRGSDLSGANLSGSDLRDADFTESIIANADFRGADLTGAKFDAVKGKDEALFS